MAFTPSYIGLHGKGTLRKRIQTLNEFLKGCRLCPRECCINRLNGETGYCRAGAKLEISSAFPHFGEEAPLVGNHGSGTIFLAHCNLRCVFCQNYDITHMGRGSLVSPSGLAKIMAQLQEAGCHNINFVTPEHVVPQILAAC